MLIRRWSLIVTVKLMPKLMSQNLTTGKAVEDIDIRHGPRPCALTFEHGQRLLQEMRSLADIIETQDQHPLSEPSSDLSHPVAAHEARTALRRGPVEHRLILALKLGWRLYQNRWQGRRRTIGQMSDVGFS